MRFRNFLEYRGETWKRHEGFLIASSERNNHGMLKFDYLFVYGMESQRDSKRIVSR